jgi:hypothetical protein
VRPRDCSSRALNVTTNLIEYTARKTASANVVLGRIEYQSTTTRTVDEREPRLQPLPVHSGCCGTGSAH